MKKYLILTLSGFIFFYSSYSQNYRPDTQKQHLVIQRQIAGKTSSVGDKNIITTNAIDQAFLNNDLSRLGDYIATDVVFHSSNGIIRGIDGIKSFFINVHKASFGEMHHQVLKTYADNEYVFQWMRAWGTNLDTKSFPPKFDVTIIGVTKFKDGKATEYWEYIQRTDVSQEPGNNSW